MRGTPSLHQILGGQFGIIPAYAGNTDASSQSTATSRDHPRVCGEHSPSATPPTANTGSSPRMRGTHAGLVDFLDLLGIIPAYAGNTTIFCHTISSHRDHPRVCGEHSLPAFQPREMTGSSPRMRGTLNMNGRCAPCAGIIPAYAGNTCASPRRIWRARDHPRVCGEHLGRLSFLLASRGSSPRMRGTHLCGAPPTASLGIIPAYAGNTPQSLRDSCRLRDHPRVCGEHTLFSCVFARSLGSSPRMRGTRLIGGV